MKTRVISLRLPNDHWIWQERDRQTVIRHALNLYYQIGDKINTLSCELNEIKDAVAEINNKIDNNLILSTKHENKETPQLSEVDPRLARSVDKLLDI